MPRKTIKRNELSVFKEDASTIMYASTWPGVGKTAWCIRQLVKRIVEKQGITFYVAPTTALLEEVRAALIKKLPDHIRALSQDDMPIHHIVSNHDNPLSVTQRIDAIVNGTNADGLGGSRRPCEDGTVLLITHEGFRNLPHNPENPFRRRSQVSVIFDEARKCIVKQLRLKIPDRMAKILLSDYLALAGDKGAYRRLQLVKSVNTKEFDLTFNDNAYMRKVRDSLRNNVLSQASTGALQVYVKWGDHSVDGKGLQVTDLHTVLIPHQLFSGWKGVVLLGAFLEDSQMFGLLKTRDVSDQSPQETKAQYMERVRRIFFITNSTHVLLKNITHHVVDQERVNKIRERYKQTTICYLSEHTSFAQRHLTHGLMVDPYLTDPANREESLEYTRQFHNLLREVPTRKGHARLTYRVASRLPLREGTSQEARKLRKHVGTAPGLITDKNRTPLQWYVAKAVEASEAWYKRNKKPNQILPISLNIGCNSAGLGHMHPKSYWNRLINIPEVAQGKCTPIPFQAHGLNKYMKLDTIAYLASVNPTPEVRRLLESICIDYDADKDNTLESCIQAVTRSSIRNIHSDSKPLLIVTDKTLALLVQDQLMGLPKVISAAELGVDVKDPYRIMPLTPAELLKEKRKSANYKTKENSSRKPLSERARAQAAYIEANSAFSKKIKSLAVMTTRLKKDGDLRYDESMIRLLKLRGRLKEEKPGLIEKFNEQYESK